MRQERHTGRASLVISTIAGGVALTSSRPAGVISIDRRVLRRKRRPRQGENRPHRDAACRGIGATRRCARCASWPRRPPPRMPHCARGRGAPRSCLDGPSGLGIHGDLRHDYW